MSRHYHRRLGPNTTQEEFAAEWERLFGKEKTEASTKTAGKENAATIEKEAVAGNESETGREMEER